MSEAYTIDGADDEIAGIVVRYEGERGFRFHSARKAFDALDGHVFVNPAAAQRAAREFCPKARTAPPRDAASRCCMKRIGSLAEGAAARFSRGLPGPSGFPAGARQELILRRHISCRMLSS